MDRHCDSIAPQIPDPDTSFERRETLRIAEQKRRERFSLALQRMEDSLPSNYKTPYNRSDEGEEDSGGTTHKRQRVLGTGVALDMAIEYIKLLQEEIEVARQRATKAERKLRQATQD